jgi:uncharacterized membrane protein
MVRGKIAESNKQQKRCIVTVEELKLEIEKLDQEERSNILYYLIDMTDSRGFDDASEEEIEAAWLDECKRRIAEIEAGTAKLVPADEVHARARVVAAERAIARARELTA